MIYNAIPLSFLIILLVLLNLHRQIVGSQNTIDVPNVILIYSRPGLYENLMAITSLNYIIQVLNLTQEHFNDGSLLSRLDSIYNCSTIAVVAYCEEPAMLHLVQIWTAERKIYFISYSCSIMGPFAQRENNVFQLEPGFSLYSTAIINNLEINFQLFQQYGIGIIVDNDSFICLQLYKSLKYAISKKLGQSTIFFTVTISKTMDLVQIKNQLKKCQEFSVPLIIILCDLHFAVEILRTASRFQGETMQNIINPFTTLLFTDISDLKLNSMELFNNSKRGFLDIQHIKRNFKDKSNSTQHSPEPIVINNIRLIIDLAINIKGQRNCSWPSKALLLKSSRLSSFHKDGSLKSGTVTLYKLSKTNYKFNENKSFPIQEAEFMECRTVKINIIDKLFYNASNCDNIYEIESKQLLRRKIRVLIENHESLLWINNRSDSDTEEFVPMIHQVLCQKLHHRHNHFCSGLLVQLLETIGKHLKIDFFYIYTEIIPISSIKSAREMIANTSIQILVFRMNANFAQNPFMDITEPFSYLEYAVMADLSSPEVLLGAAFKPFTLFVWIMICVIATVCAVAMALYEWHSPFGLNPWGRQRNVNYSLASALTSVWAMLFGHTIHTKAPKSWPVKVLKNFWACACIVIVAMYTANLTVFIAGILQNDICHYYKDGKFKSAMRADLKGISTQLRHMNCLNLSSNSIIAKDDKEAQELFLNKTVQILIGEKYELEKFQYINALCKAIISPLRLDVTFGFSFGFEPGSPLFKNISRLLLEFQTMGFMDILQKSFRRRVPKCSLTMQSNTTNKGYGIGNVSGCFLFIGVGFLVSLLVLFLEHILFRLIVPQWRNLPETSKWKGISVLFISQRLHRVIHSERLIKPNETTREMIAIVRNREFHKIFFKENMHKPLPSRIMSPAKISVFDISSEMVKMKRRSFESIVAIENSSNQSSTDEANIEENTIIPNNNIIPNSKAPLVSIEDEDFIFTSFKSKQISDDSNSSFTSSAKYSRNKWRKKPLIKLSKDSDNSLSSIRSTDSKYKYHKNPKLYQPTLHPLKGNNERKPKTLLRMQCLDQD